MGEEMVWVTQRDCLECGSTLEIVTSPHLPEKSNPFFWLEIPRRLVEEYMQALHKWEEASDAIEELFRKNIEVRKERYKHYCKKKRIPPGII